MSSGADPHRLPQLVVLDMGVTQSAVKRAVAKGASNEEEIALPAVRPAGFEPTTPA